MKHVSAGIAVVAVLAGVLLAAVPLASGQQTAVRDWEGETDERGLPFPSEHYAPSEYGASPQNWAVAQDSRGLTYIANNEGILQYDGERWRLIPTATGTFVRSLAVDSVVYVGAKGDFGVLRPDSSGMLQYQSLHKRAKAPRHSFKDVWSTHVLADGAYFQANKWLFRWDGTQITSWKSEGRFHTSFAVEDRLYVRDSERGLLRMENDSLTLVPGGSTFSGTPIYMMAPHPSGEILIATQNMGLQLYGDGDLRPLSPELTPYLAKHDLYHGCKLPGDRYALATLGGGVWIIGADGQLVRVLDESSALPDEVVNAVYATEETVQIEVKDTGVGIDEALIPDLFEEFRQGTEGRERSYEGYGLGLAISSRMVELMEAELSVESTKGEGSVFTVCMSRRSAPSKEGEHPNSENE